MEATKGKSGISAGTLKLIAMAVMLVDHFAVAVLIRVILSRQYPHSKEVYQVYQVMRQIGRTAFPIYCYLLVEGLFYTRNKWKYTLRLTVFAAISEVPFDLALKSKVLEFGYQNVFFTLALSLFMLIVVQKVEERDLPVITTELLRLAVVAAFMAAAYFLRTDYSYKGVICVYLLYLYRDHRKLQLVIGYLAFVLTLGEFAALPAFVLLYFYHGKKGVSCKYLFYAFYPLHLLILYGICVFMGIANISALS